MIGTLKERNDELIRRYPVWEEKTLYTAFLRSADMFPENSFVIFDDVTCTFSQTRSLIEDTARALRALGVNEGDHVAVSLHNCPEFIILIFALSRTGAVKIPVNVNVKGQELGYILSQADADYLIAESVPDNLPDRIRAVVTVDNGGHTASPSSKTVAGHAVTKNHAPGTVPAVQADSGHCRAVSHAESNTSPSSVAKSFTDRENCPVLSWEAFLGQGKAAAMNDAPGTQDPLSMSDILFTSGSTSAPKGVVLTHDMLLRSAFSTCLTRGFETGRRIYVPIPLYHAFAYVEGLLAAMFVGGSVVMTRAHFNVQNALRQMREHRVHDIICVSVIMHKLLVEGHPVPEDYPDMHAAYWASACADWIWEAGRKAFGISDITTSYGMTECGSTTVMTGPGDPPDTVRKYNGRQKPAGPAALPDAQGCQFHMKLVIPGTCTAPAIGEPGELLCKGKTISPGYYKNVAANERAFDDQGWFHTGDLLSVSADGYYKFMGRINDMYKINGENVSPGFIDSVIGKCPLVKEIETVGILHDKYGEVGISFIELEQTALPASAASSSDAAVSSDTPPSAAARSGMSEGPKSLVKQYASEHLAAFQVPRYWCFSSQEKWPHTAGNKISKTVLRQNAQDWFHSHPEADQVQDVPIF